jgi:nucleoside-diphosphate-sugar epimerase
LGWTPKVPLEAGLRKTIAYFDTLLKENRTPTGRRLEA